MKNTKETIKKLTQTIKQTIKTFITWLKIPAASIVINRH